MWGCSSTAAVAVGVGLEAGVLAVAAVRLIAPKTNVSARIFEIAFTYKTPSGQRPVEKLAFPNLEVNHTALKRNPEGHRLTIPNGQTGGSGTCD
jgi:hypothetical protein